MTGFPLIPLAYKVELNLNGTWTDVTQFVLQRDNLVISSMGRPDQSSSINAAQLGLTFKNNDGRFIPVNTAGPYYPYIGLNTQIRVSINSQSRTGVAYSGYRYCGVATSWPPGFDQSGRSVYVPVTASGAWGFISQSTATIGSAFTRFVQQQTGTLVPAGYWSMQDGSGSTAFVTTIGAGANGTFSTSSLPSFASDSTSFPGSDAVPQLNGARITFPVSSGATPTDNVAWFALSVPAAGDSFIGTTEIGQVFEVTSAGTVGIAIVQLLGNKLTLTGYTSGLSQLFTGTISTPVNGVPVLVSYELTATTWALRIIKPGGTAVLDQVTGSHTQTVGAISQVQVNPQGRLTDTTGGQLGVFYAIPSLTGGAAALGAHAGEFAVDRFNRLCAEQGIATEVIGSASAAMGPQADDTLANLLQIIESTDGGLLYETRDQFGLGYRTLGSLQNQSSALALSFTGSQIAAGLSPVYDNQLLANQVPAVNWDGYTAVATLTSGSPLSVQAPPAGAGVYAPVQVQVCAASHAQVGAVAQQRMFTGTVNDVRYPVITVNLAAPGTAGLFSSVPSLRVGDYFQIANLPAYAGAATAKQLAWGWTETIQATTWTIALNAIPEASFETAFSPGVYSVAQAASAPVTAGAAAGAVSGAQIAAGAVGGGQLASVISARSIGGSTSFISAATPYDWSFAVSGTPSGPGYFICTEVQGQPIAAGDTFTNSGGLGGPFTVTSVAPPSGGNVAVSYTPDATAVMSTGTVSGGKNGDTWVNTSGGNQVSIWAAGAWVPVTWNASSVLTAASITASLIAAGTVIAGAVNGTTITGATLTGATIVADGTSGEFLGYSGTPALGDLIASISAAAGSDASLNAYLAGLASYADVSGTFYAAALQAGGLSFQSAPAAGGSWTQLGNLFLNAPARLQYQDSSSLTRNVPLSASQVNNTILGNSTTAAALGGPFNIPPDLGLGDTVEIELPFNAAMGATTAEGVNLYYNLNSSSNVLMATIGTVAAAGANFDGWVCLCMKIVTLGTSGACRLWLKGGLLLTAGNINAANAVDIASTCFTGVAINTTILNTLQLAGAWTGAGGTGQNFTCLGATCKIY